MALSAPRTTVEVRTSANRMRTGGGVGRGGGGGYSGGGGRGGGGGGYGANRPGDANRGGYGLGTGNRPDPAAPTVVNRPVRKEDGEAPRPRSSDAVEVNPGVWRRGGR